MARVKAFDVLTAEEPADTAAKIIELYEMRWQRFPEVAQARFYTFATFALFKEWAFGAPEHVAIHRKLLEAMKARTADSGGGAVQPISVLPSCSFHATDAPRAQIPALRAELRQIYQQIDASDWAGVPAGSVQLMMLGDHD